MSPSVQYIPHSFLASAPSCNSCIREVLLYNALRNHVLPSGREWEKSTKRRGWLARSKIAFIPSNTFYSAWPSKLPLFIYIFAKCSWSCNTMIQECSRIILSTVALEASAQHAYYFGELFCVHCIAHRDSVRLGRARAFGELACIQVGCWRRYKASYILLFSPYRHYSVRKCYTDANFLLKDTSITSAAFLTSASGTSFTESGVQSRRRRRRRAAR